MSGPQGPIELKAPKQRVLLAVLLLAYRDDSVSAARLVDELWGNDPPATAAKAVQVHLSKLRSALGPEQPIVTRPSGYAVDIEPEQLDLARFEALSERARAAGRDGDPQAAAGLWREALALFRGRPLEDVPLRGLAATEASRLAELQVAAVEERIAVELELGEHVAVAGELQAPGRRAPVPRAAARAADARPLPVRPPGRGARRVPPRAADAGRGPRARARPRAAAARERGAGPGSGARPAAGRAHGGRERFPFRRCRRRPIR